MESILVALIGGAVTLAGVVASNSRSRAVLEQKVDELSRRVEKHNCLVERTYRLERDDSPASPNTTTTATYRGAAKATSAATSPASSRAGSERGISLPSPSANRAGGSPFAQSPIRIPQPSAPSRQSFGVPRPSLGGCHDARGSAALSSGVEILSSPSPRARASPRPSPKPRARPPYRRT